MTEAMDELKHMFRLTRDGDSWGRCVIWLFAVCECLHWHHGREVPAEWAFVPGAGDGSEGSFERDVLEAMPADVVLAFGHRLERLSRMLKAEGKDY